MRAGREGVISGRWTAVAAPAVPPLTAAALSVVVIVSGWRGSDLPAQVFRIGLVKRYGLQVWDNFWFGGHHTVGYGILLPVLGALVGMWTVAVVSSAVSAWLVDALIVGATGRRVWAATLWFAVGTASNVAVGRLAFALGLMLGLASLLAVQRGRVVTALVLAVATPLASPVVSVFLAIVCTALAVVDRQRRQVAGALALATVAPVVAIAVIYPQGGTFPYSFGSLTGTVLAALAVAGLSWRSSRLVAVAGLLYAGAAVAAFLVPSPLGANITRFGMYAAAPALLAVVSGRRRALAVMLPILAFWQWSPSVDAVVRAPNDPSINASYAEPLNQFLEAANDGPVRVEIVPTQRHWETAYVALNTPIARGWERQLDRSLDALFYEPDLTAETYTRWLRETGVRYVALADAPLDQSGKAEAALLQGGVPGLRPVWSNEHWRVWEVSGASGLVAGPARLVSMGIDEMVVDVTGPGDVLVRVRSSARWRTTPPTCLQTSAEDWLVLRQPSPGRYHLEVDDSTLSGTHQCDP